MWYAVVSVAWGEWTHTRKMILEGIVGGGPNAPQGTLQESLPGWS